jgi:two-component system, OmpR family, sensor kinase
MSEEADASQDQPQTIEALKQALRVRDEFLSVAAHELRNPLTPISMQVGLLLRLAHAANPPLPAQFVAGLERLDQATKRFLNRATVLLDVSRLIAGHGFRPDVTSFDLSALVRDLVADQAPMAERLRIVLDTAAIENDVVGAWDRVGVGLIFDNLISNAMKHGAGAPITIALRRFEEGGHPCVEIRVKDHGPGIAPDDHERIFARFQQAQPTAATTGGFGVGLWVAREVARGMCGDIRVDSSLGSGATFIVTLPRDVAAYLAAIQTAAMNPSMNGQNPGKGEK